MTNRSTSKTSRSITTLALALIQAAALSVLLSSCVVAAGNRAAPPVEQTLGRQLMDLKEARDGGAMTESEYQQKRQELLSSGS